MREVEILQFLLETVARKPNSMLNVLYTFLPGRLGITFNTEFFHNKTAASFFGTSEMPSFFLGLSLH